MTGPASEAQPVPQSAHPLGALTTYELTRYRRELERALKGLGVGVPARRLVQDKLAQVLAERDVKGLYKRALAGEIPHFTGITDPYEPPLHPEVTVNSSQETPEQSLEKIWATLERLGLVCFDRSALAH